MLSQNFYLGAEQTQAVIPQAQEEPAFHRSLNLQSLSSHPVVEAKYDKTESDAHPGEYKYGEHWYKKNDYVVNPVDKFADYFDDSMDELIWIGQEGDWIYEQTVDMSEIFWAVLKGFFDRGYSWEWGYAVLKHNDLEGWLSPQTKKQIQNWIFYIKAGDYSGYAKCTNEYYQERIGNIFKHMTVMSIFRFFELFSQFIIVVGGSEDGKMSIFNRTFTGFITIWFGWVVIICQWIFEIWPSNYWLRGNIVAIIDHMFAGMQWILGSMLLLDIHAYVYTFRVIRISSFFLAFFYNLIYLFNAAIAIDLAYVQDFWKDDDSQAIPDFVLASVTSYAAVHFVFTEFFQLVILFKEMTYNPFAASASEDYESGKVGGSMLDINVDLFYWFGVDSNVDDYWEIAREFSATFL